MNGLHFIFNQVGFTSLILSKEKGTMKWEKIINKEVSPPLICKGAFKEYEGIFYVIKGREMYIFSSNNYAFDIKSTLIYQKLFKVIF